MPVQCMFLHDILPYNEMVILKPTAAWVQPGVNGVTYSTVHLDIFSNID